MEEIPSRFSIEIADAHMATDGACDLGIDEVRSLDEFNFGEPAGRFRTKRAVMMNDASATITARSAPDRGSPGSRQR